MAMMTTTRLNILQRVMVWWSMPATRSRNKPNDQRSTEIKFDKIELAESGLTQMVTMD